MGAHLSTVQNTLKERFQICDEYNQGHLVSWWSGDCCNMLCKSKGPTETLSFCSMFACCCRHWAR
jgi:hypothetical protein